MRCAAPRGESCSPSKVMLMLYNTPGHVSWQSTWSKPAMDWRKCCCCLLLFFISLLSFLLKGLSGPLVLSCAAVKMLMAAARHLRYSHTRCFEGRYRCVSLCAGLLFGFQAAVIPAGWQHPSPYLSVSTCAATFWSRSDRVALTWSRFTAQKRPPLAGWGTHTLI